MEIERWAQLGLGLIVILIGGYVSSYSLDLRFPGALIGGIGVLLAIGPNLFGRGKKIA